jgi:hypothetical protein
LLSRYVLNRSGAPGGAISNLTATVSSPLLVYVRRNRGELDAGSLKKISALLSAETLVA